MPERIHIRPRHLTPEEAIQFDRPESDRLVVLDPMTSRPLPEAGQVVVQSTYWFKRVACGDVEIVKPDTRRSRPRTSDKEE